MSDIKSWYEDGTNSYRLQLFDFFKIFKSSNFSGVDLTLLVKTNTSGNTDPKHRHSKSWRQC